MVLSTLGFLTYQQWAEQHEAQLEQMHQAEVEQLYLTRVAAFLEEFQTHQSEYNVLLERTKDGIEKALTKRSGLHTKVMYNAEAAKARAFASPYEELPEGLTNDVTSLGASVLEFRDFLGEFTMITPPPQFFGFHMIMNNALTEYIEAAQCFSTHYSQELARRTNGAEASSLGDIASELLLIAEGTFEAAEDMYADLIMSVR